VTVVDPDGRRHSLDVLADSTYDAAHLFVVEAKKESAVGLPKPTLATVFEVVTSGKVYHVAGAALQRWIVERRQTLERPERLSVRPAPWTGVTDRPGNPTLDRLWRLQKQFRINGRASRKQIARRDYIRD
jgi:hypothetical protein